jgi:hypothetical protein
VTARAGQGMARVRSGLAPGCGPGPLPLPPPVGLTAADPFAAGKVSRAASRVRQPGSFTCSRCPAGTAALDAVPEAHHNPAAVWWGPLRLPGHVVVDQAVPVEPRPLVGADRLARQTRSALQQQILYKLGVVPSPPKPVLHD